MTSTTTRKFMTTKKARMETMRFLADYLAAIRDGEASVTIHGSALATDDDTTTLRDVLKAADIHAWADEVRAEHVSEENWHREISMKHEAERARAEADSRKRGVCYLCLRDKYPRDSTAEFEMVFSTRRDCRPLPADPKHLACRICRNRYPREVATPILVVKAGA